MDANSSMPRPSAPSSSSRSQRLYVPLAVALLATLIAYLQFRGPFVWHEPHRRLAWFVNPLEWRIDAALPEIGSGVTAITFFDDKVWIAGNGGFLAFSRDAGLTWTTMNFDRAQRRFSLPPDVSTDTVPRTAGGWTLPRFGVALHAAEPQQAAAPPRQAQQPPAPGDQKGGAQPTQEKYPPAELVSDQKEILFDPVIVGRFQRARLTLKAASGRAAFPSAAIIGGENAFSLPPTDCTVLTEGQACTMFVQFTPKAAQSYDAIFRWENLSMPMHGEGIPPPVPDKAPAEPSKPQEPSNPPAKAEPATSQPPRSPSASVETPLAPPADLIDFDTQRCSTRAECSVRSSDEVFTTTDRGVTWTRAPASAAVASYARPDLPKDAFNFGITKPSTPPVYIHAEAHDDARARRWIVDSRGYLWSSIDRGAHWLPMTRSAAASLPEHATVPLTARYVRLPAPWYGLVLLVCALLIHVGSRVAAGAPASSRATPSAHDGETTADDETIAGNYGQGDKPLERGQPDALGLGAIAAGLAFFLRNEDTKPPLVIAVNGRWGSGKSSLMNLLRTNLEQYGSRPVWFNAWHHQSEEQLLAALLQAVKREALPRLWSRGGWSFRARLAASRFERYWPQVAIGIALVYLIWRGEPVLLQWLNESTAVAAADPNSGSTLELLRLRTIVGWIESKQLVTLVTAAAAAAKAISGGLRAFASDPASLLAAEAGGTSPKALQAQTTFRVEFAKEFCDVTWALGPRRRMLILIDDLDRCRPEKVREVFEAVNFLVSSGDCFVVLGMAREIVEHCVGLSFQNVVDTMPWHSFDITPDEKASTLKDVADGGGAKDVPMEIAAKRRAFARRFLDKLVQIELSLPEPTPLQKRRLFDAADAPSGDAAAREARVRKWMRAGRLARQLTAPVLQTALVAAILVGAAVEGWRLFGPRPAAVVTAPIAPAPASVAPVTAPGDRVVVQPPPLPIVREAPRVVPPPSPVSSGLLAAWPFYFAAFALALLALGAIGEVPETIVRDDRAFVEAMRVWHPLVLTSGARNTPRTARRFANRVRYLAMRQRALSMEPPMSRVEAWVRRALGAPATRPDPPVRLSKKVQSIDEGLRELEVMLGLGLHGKTSLGTLVETDDGLTLQPDNALGVDATTLRSLAVGNIFIPETILVALAAIHEYEPSWIESELSFQKMVVGAVGGNDQDDEQTRLLREAIGQHRSRWDNINDRLTQYRRAYLRLCSEVRSAEQVAGAM